MKRGKWTVAEAKSRFSELLDRARSHGPQTVTRHGRTAAIVSPEEWERKTKRTGNLAEFFAASPLRNAAIRIERRKERPRKVDL
ncbi:MAG: prevent-host-death protein [Bradyrhizobiaceae bacterium]|nr:MAG: prevent-host-death protein [Bradyrhizobiaceae bacterium]